MPEFDLPAGDMPEKPCLRLGLMPLADAAPIVVAQARGYFARHGLDVEIAVERAWAAVRDKVATGVLDAAQMLAPMPLAATLGLDGVRTPMLTAMTLSLNGNAIVVSEDLHARMCAFCEEVGGADEQPKSKALVWARALKRLIDFERRSGKPAPVFAHVYPYSTHHYELRYWLAAGGIQPDRDLNLIVVPPPQAVAQLESGRIDGFCVGAPWGEVAERRGVGRRIVSKYQIWNNSPEKVLGVTQAWAALFPRTHLALVAALIEANRWLDQPGNRAEAARLLSEEHYLEAPSACVRDALSCKAADADFGPGLVFHAGAAGFPWRSQARWFLTQMQRWNHLRTDINSNAVTAAVYRPDLFRSAAAMVGVATPAVDEKVEGVHAGNWTLAGSPSAITMGADRFLDHRVFEPAAGRNVIALR